ncbi:hypothetical protein HY991_06205 [Candidatus Micrarchaeota archaeon]|nr:hypothetical protein [Candidatus Micrarchaeota archaeon]
MKRSQVEAPIELWLTAIILVALMGLIYYVYTNIVEAKCIAEMKDQTRKLAVALTEIAPYSPPTSREVEFRMMRCGSISIEGVRFVYYQHQQYCSDCPGSVGGCWKIEPFTVDELGRDVPVRDAGTCIVMSGIAWISQDTSSGCQFVSTDPCTSPVFDSVTSATYCPHIPQSVWKKTSMDPLGSNSPTRWGVFRRSSTETVYSIKLTKSLAAVAGGSSGMEAGQINVCAKLK